MNEKRCWLCGRNGTDDPLDVHHIFNGSNKKNSEKYGALVYLCHNRCHIFGKYAVHQNRETRDKLMKWGQAKVMEENDWTTEDFIRVFGKNFL